MKNVIKYGWLTFCVILFLTYSIESLILAHKGNYAEATYYEIISLSVWVICIKPDLK